MNWIQSASGQICLPYGFPKPKANNMFKAEFTPAVRNTDLDLQVLCMSICTLKHTNFCYIGVLLLKKHPFYTGKGISKKPSIHHCNGKKPTRYREAWKTTDKDLFLLEKKKRTMETWSINTSNNLNVLLVWFKTLVIPGSAKNNRCCSFDGKYTILFTHLMELIVTIHCYSAWREDQYHRCG